MELTLTPSEIVVLYKLLHKIVASYGFDPNLCMFVCTKGDFLIDFYEDEFKTLKSLRSDLSCVL